MAARSQSLPPPAQLRFIVASIKERDAQTPLDSVGLQRSPGRLVSHCATLKSLIFYAFTLTLSSPIKGLPNWAETPCSEGISANTYQFEATTPPDTTDLQAREMMRTFLADRFKLKFHQETENRGVYALVIAPGGFKLASSDPKDEQRGFIECPADDRECHRIGGGSVPTSELAGLLGLELGRPVVDKTGLIGRYRLDFRWAGDSSPNSSLPSLRGALKETFGLELKSVIAPVQVLVVTHAEKPSRN